MTFYFKDTLFLQSSKLRCTMVRLQNIMRRTSKCNGINVHAKYHNKETVITHTGEGGGGKRKNSYKHSVPSETCRDCLKLQSVDSKYFDTQLRKKE